MPRYDGVLFLVSLLYFSIYNPIATFGIYSQPESVAKGYELVLDCSAILYVTSFIFMKIVTKSDTRGRQCSLNETSTTTRLIMVIMVVMNWDKTKKNKHSLKYVCMMWSLPRFVWVIDNVFAMTDCCYGWVEKRPRQRFCFCAFF